MLTRNIKRVRNGVLALLVAGGLFFGVTHISHAPTTAITHSTDAAAPDGPIWSDH